MKKYVKPEDISLMREFVEATRDMSQEDVAAKLGMSRGFVQMWRTAFAREDNPLRSLNSRSRVEVRKFLDRVYGWRPKSEVGVEGEGDSRAVEA